MKNIFLGLLLCIQNSNQLFCNVSWIEQKFSYTLMPYDQNTTLGGYSNDINENKSYDLTEPFTDNNNNNVYDSAENFIDTNNNGKYDGEENYQDDNKNGKWDNEEPYTDLNNSGSFDFEEPYTDKSNGIYDLGEDFIDLYKNNIWDAHLWYVDSNNDDKWNDGELFEDLNNNDKRDINETFTDENNNYRYDEAEEIGDSKFNLLAKEFSEPYTDVPNGRYDMGEEFKDFNRDGQRTAIEEYEDINGDGQWTAAEEYEDINGDGQWTAAEEYEDINGDGQWTAAEEFIDLNENGIWDEGYTESLINDTLITSKQNTTIEEQTESVFESSPKNGILKSPGKALLYSGVLPGMGQAYMGNWIRALLFVAIDGVAIGTWNRNDVLADEKKKEYSHYANEHWEFANWIHDYYKWYPEDSPTWFSGADSSWSSIREVFVNRTDTGCHEAPYCYKDIWKNSHNIEFTWNGETINSNDEEIPSGDEVNFRYIYKELCGIQYYDRECERSLEEIEIEIDANKVYVIKDHHFYEGIQKYDMFFAGWDDNDSVTVVVKKHGDKNATSPNQIAYRNLWGDYNTIKTLAVNGGKFMLINRVVSMVDALLLAKKWNNNHDVKLSLNTYPDLRNKSGLGGVKLSLHWK